MPVGVVRYFLPDRGFGFLKYSSNGSDRLDREAHFRVEALQTFVQAGDRVEFEFGLDENDREEAIAVAPLNDRLTGIVCTNGRKSYGYIQVDGRFGDNQQVFVAFDDVIPDLATGKRWLPVGAKVSFR